MNSPAFWSHSSVAWSWKVRWARIHSKTLFGCHEPDFLVKGAIAGELEKHYYVHNLISFANNFHNSGGGGLRAQPETLVLDYISTAEWRKNMLDEG